MKGLEYLHNLALAIKADNEAHPERTELLATLRDQFAWTLETEPALMKIAEALLAAGYRKPRTVSTIEELDALPNKAVVLDAAEDVWRQDDHPHTGKWWDKLVDEDPTSERSSYIELPATVLHEGRVTA